MSFSLISVPSRSSVNFLKEAAFGFNYFSILFLLFNLHDFFRFISFFSHTLACVSVSFLEEGH